MKQVLNCKKVFIGEIILLILEYQIDFSISRILLRLLVAIIQQKRASCLTRFITRESNGSLRRGSIFRQHYFFIVHGQWAGMRNDGDKRGLHKPRNLVIPSEKEKRRKRINWSVNPAARSLANGCSLGFSFSSCLHTCAGAHCGAPMCQMITSRVRQVSLRISHNTAMLIRLNKTPKI